MNPAYTIGVALVCLILATSSCKQILLMRYDIRQPREETPGTILAFMEKMDYLNENTFIFKDSSAFNTFMRDSVFRDNVLGMLFFSAQGLLANYKDTSRCQWSGSYFVRNLHSAMVYPADTGYTLQKLMNSVVPLNQATHIDTTNADYIVVITWATFLGKYNERMFSIRDAIRENTEVSVKPVFLCIDIQKEWSLAEREKNALRFE